MTTWNVSTDVGVVAWSDGLQDDTALQTFSEWAKATGSVSVTPTGPTLKAWPLNDEVTAWWVALAWTTDTRTPILAMTPPTESEPWSVDDPVDAIY